MNKKFLRLMSMVLAVLMLSIVMASVPGTSVKAATTYTIASGGTTQFKIVRSDTASASTLKAATEMQTFIQQISGVTVPIVNDSGALSAHEIIIGNNAHTTLTGTTINWTSLGDEGYTIRTTNGAHIVIAGSDVRGSLYGVYTFLEKQLGCRWWTSTESYIPSTSTLSISDVDYTETPVLKYRDILMKDYMGATDFQVRMRLNGHSAAQFDLSIPSTAQGGTFGPFAKPYWHTCLSPELMSPSNIFSGTTTYLVAHPEWYAQDASGNRAATQLCWSNAGMRDQLYAQIRQWMLNNPTARYFHVSQADNNGTCNCSTCVSFYNSHLDRNGNPGKGSTMIDALNDMCNRLRTEFPNNKLVTFAYAWSQYWPAGMNVDSNLWIQYAPIENNGDMQQIMDEWNVKAPGRILIWDYISAFGNYICPLPNLYKFQLDLQDYVAHGAVGDLAQGNYNSQGGDMQALKNYVLAKLMWNPNQDIDALINDFGSGYYGAAWPKIRSYIDIMYADVKDMDNFNLYTISDAKWALCQTKNMGYFTTFFKWPWVQWMSALYCNPDQMTTYKQLFTDARSLVSSDSTRLSRVKMAQMAIQNVLIESLPKNSERSGTLSEFNATATAGGVNYFSEFETMTTYKARVTANNNAAPTVSITAPTNTSNNYMVGASATIEADALDSNGTVTKVEFYNGTTLLGTDTAWPFSYTWSNLAMGSYKITAKAYDNFGVVTTSAFKRINVFGTQDVGTTGIAGSASQNGNTFTVTGAGMGPYTTADSFRYLYTQRSGDFYLATKLASFNGTLQYANAGVVVRQNLTAGAKSMFATYFPNSQDKHAWSAYRTTASGNIAYTMGPIFNNTPMYLSVQRIGTIVSMWSSPDNVTWTQIGTDLSVSLTDPVYVGLGVASGDTTSTKTATFDYIEWDEY